MVDETLEQEEFRGAEVLLADVQNIYHLRDPDERGRPLCGRSLSGTLTRVDAGRGTYECAMCAAVDAGELDSPASECPFCPYDFAIAVSRIGNRGHDPGQHLLAHVREHQEP